MNVSNVTRVLFYTHGEGVDGLFEFLLVAVGQADMVEDVGLIGVEGLVGDSGFERLYAFFVFFKGVVGQT